MIDALMQHDVIPIKVAVNNFGDPSETALSTEKGFFEYDEKSTYDRDGNVVRCVGSLYLKPTSGYDPTLVEGGKKVQWKFTDVKNSRTFQLEEFQIIDDPRTGNTHHYELLLR